MHKHTPPQDSNQQGQSMVEYALIVALLVLALVVALAATGPAIGNVFSNTVYNLLGTDPDEIAELPDREAFWLTVTWVAQQTPVEEPLPTRTPLKATEVPTDGPSPTPSPTVPTNTPPPTETPAPTATPRDLEFIAPWHDSAEEDNHWRLGGGIFLGADEGWYAEYFADTALTSSSSGQFISEIDPALQYNLDFNWGSSSPIEDWPVGDEGNNFSISFRREIYVDIDAGIMPEVTLLLEIEQIDDGAQVWLIPGHGDITSTRDGGCSATGIPWGGSQRGSGSPTIFDDSHSTYSDDCLLLDGWHYIGGYVPITIERTIPTRTPYTLVVNMYDGSGNAKVKLGIDAVGFGGNEDDALIDGGGAVQTGAPDCRWNNAEDTRDSNSPDFRWDAWDSYYYGVGNRCYLELRGSVEIPTGMLAPVLTFWDVWDFRDPSMQAWVEIANYDPDNDGIFDRDDLVWTRQTLHVGSSTNYNWTYQRIDLLNLLGLATMEGNKYAIRFGMEVPQASYSVGNDRGYRLWWIDSITIDEQPQSTFYMAQEWTLDDLEEANDFITSGRWKLSEELTRGGGGYAWNDSAFVDYEKTNIDGCGHSSSGCSDYDDQNLRMHTLEFNGVVDLFDELGETDLEGDTGDAMLTFWHAYDIDRYTGLEIQYTTDLNYDSGAPPQWKVIPGGQINVRNSSSRPEEGAMLFAEIDLEQLLVEEPAANGKFRIRFALTVGRFSDTDPGWWIDDIKLERAAISNFLPYPYLEDFEQEETLNDWLLGGTWDRVDNRAYRPVSGTGHSLTDSPYSTGSDGSIQQETFATDQESTVELRLAFDVNNDSPTNPFSPECALDPSDPCTEDDNDLPVDPIMTFQWWHDFGSSGGEHFYVEWKKADETSVWQELWSYRDRMSYNSSSDSSTRIQMNWQRVEIDLRQIWVSGGYENGVPDAATDDDILFRFRFETNGNNNGADGIYIDEIRIEERQERSFALWDAGVDSDVENPTFPSSDPLLYTTGGYRYVRFIADSEVNGNAWTTIAEFNLLDKNGDTIPRAGWTIDSFSSQRSGDEIEDMLDGNTGTQWFTQSSPTVTHPHQFELDLGADYQVSFFQILPRQLDPSNSWYQNGWIEDFRFYVSENGTDWELAKDGQLATTQAQQTVSLQIDYTTDTPPSGSGSTVTVTGDGVSYRDNLDDRANELFDNWYLGGTWEVIEWEQYDGVLAFHDSTANPLNGNGDEEVPPPDPDNNNPYVRNSGRTYNVLEMSTIIDLRATDASRLPIMTFWQRHHIGSGSYIRVQIAEEDPDTIGTSGHCFSSSRDQCYEHLYGWSQWQTAPPWEQSGYNDWNKSGEVRQYLWKREIVDLSPYAASVDDPGKRIRIRFISDSMDRGEGDNNLKDGWYIDNLEFKYNIPSVVNIDVDTGDSFFDAARNIRNWIPEGTWGLSPEFFRGSGGGPADFGGAFWNYSIYDMGDCNTSNSGFRDCVRNRFDAWDDQDDGAAFRVKEGVALDINYDWGSGGPAGLNSKFAGIWEITTPTIGTTMTSGNYTLIFTYDEALRVKFDTVPGGDLPDIEGVDPYDPEWNIYDDFSTGSRSVNIGSALFENGNQYKIRMEFFDRWGDATLILSIGSNSFSFTDSPKQASGAAFPEVPAAPRSTSSLIFKGVFDLKDAVAPLLQYYTYHELGGTAKVEVTTDGGFLWQQTGLIGSTPTGFWTSDWSADFWDDSGRANNDKMAYDSNTGTYELGTYPPDISVASYYDGDFDFNWGNGSPYAGVPSNNWSSQFRRSFYVPAQTDITFKVTSDDGHRLWFNQNGTGYYPQCAFLDNDGSKPFVSGKPRMSGEDDETIGGTSNSCMLISDWEDGGNNYKEVTRTIPAGNHEIVMDHYEGGGGAKLQLEVLAGNYDNPNYGGTYMPDDGTGDWRQKVHSLEYYAGYEADGDPKPPVGLRFRLDRLGESETGNYQQASNQNDPNVNWMESWWITDILIVDTVSGP